MQLCASCVAKSLSTQHFQPVLTLMFSQYLVYFSENISRKQLKNWLAHDFDIVGNSTCGFEAPFPALELKKRTTCWSSQMFFFLRCSSFSSSLSGGDQRDGARSRRACQELEKSKCLTITSLAGSNFKSRY